MKMLSSNEKRELYHHASLYKIISCSDYLKKMYKGICLQIELF